jgi:hypothetical protein
MVRTASNTAAPPIVSSGVVEIEPAEPITPSQPTLLRPKPRKAPETSEQTQSPSNPRRKANFTQQRRRAHSRVSDSGWLTDEIIGGQIDDFDFEKNLGKFDKRRDWEEFRVILSSSFLTIENG